MEDGNIRVLLIEDNPDDAAGTWKNQPTATSA
jgi:hypothetical protein